MARQGVEARVLADDIMIMTGGKRMLRRFGQALHMSHVYLIDIGARISPDKSFNFALSKAAADWLK